MNITQALNYIHSTSWKGSIPGLSRTQELLDRMGNPHERLKFIHIAGTNGKGSTAAMLSCVLRAAGYRTGLYTSPFILRFNERMQVDGQMIPDEALAEITQFIRPHAQAMEDHPTEFELVTAIAMEYFMRRRCDIVVLEVGLGGELDSTNVISAPEAAVICNIGLDHTQILGNTLEQIAAAKAGIIKRGCDVALYRSTPEVERVFEERCTACGAQLHRASFDSLHLLEHSFAGQVFDYAGQSRLELPLLGAHQLKNAAVAITTIDILTAKGWRISEAQLREGLRNVSWPGRFERLRTDPIFIVDGGHNAQCVEALAHNIRDYLPDRRITALTGVMADKDSVEMYRLIAPYVERFITVTPNNPRALPAQELGKLLSHFQKPVTICERVADGVRKSIAQTPSDGAVVAFGSLYMVGEIRESVCEMLA